MHLLDGPAARTAPALTSRLLTVFEVEAGQDHARIVKAAGSALVYPDLALLAFVVPHSRCLVTSAGDKSRVGWVQIDLRDHV